MTQKEYHNGVRSWADDVYRFALCCCGDEELARDAVQEAYAALWERLGQVAADKGKAFLLSVAHNHLMSCHRREKVRRQASQWACAEQVVAPDERFDLQEALRRALSFLPEVQRAAIVLKDMEGYSCREIAGLLSLSEKQVTVYLFRARVSLKKSLIKLGYDNNNR